MAYNDSQLEEDPFQEFDQINTEKHNEYRTMQNVELVSNIVKIILGLCVVAVNILLIYVISKSKRLKSRVTSYIMHFAIFNMLYFVTQPLFHGILLLLNMSLHIEFYDIVDSVLHILFIFEHFCLVTTFLFAFALSFDWLVMLYKPDIGLKIKYPNRYPTILIYTLSCVMFFVVYALHLSHIVYKLSPFVVLVVYSLVVLFTVVMTYLSYRYKSTIRNADTAYSLSIANAILLPWLPLLSFHLVLGYSFNLILLILTQIMDLTSFSSSIIITVVLVRRNKYFWMALAKIFKRSVKNYDNDVEEILDASETDNEVNTQVTYNNVTTSIKI